MEYSESLTNEEYLANFKTCKTCPHWAVDPTLQGDYAYNFCQKHIGSMTYWATWCKDYAGDRVNESPNQIFKEQRDE